MSKEQFPRGSLHPKQSPLFWVQQKDRYLRQLLIRDIEEKTGRSLIVYFANRFQKGSDIDPKDPAFMAELLSNDVGKPIDLLLETGGGFTDSTEALVSLLKNTTPDFRVIVANAAKSNGTLLALASKSIVMGATSELGPIDPHINGTPCNILVDPSIAQTNLPLSKLAENFIKQTQRLAESVLSEGMMAGADMTAVQQTVHLLSTHDRFHSHGSVIDCKEARALGLTVEYLEPNDDLWRQIWLLYSMYDYDSNKNGYIKLFETSVLSTAISA